MTHILDKNIDESSIDEYYSNRDIEQYTVKELTEDVNLFGVIITWQKIIHHFMDKIKTLDNRLNYTSNSLFTIDNIGDTYELTLAIADKDEKKISGTYFTPIDVCETMAKWFRDKCKGENVADVCCGTGNLILTYLDMLSESERNELFEDRKLYLYDNDMIALTITLFLIKVKYGVEYTHMDRLTYGDFMSYDVQLPKNCKVISNPPYAKIDSIPDSWMDDMATIDDVVLQSRDLAFSIINKILTTSVSSVIIAPFTFMGGKKYHKFRLEMNKHNGFIVSFDNVPGNIFNGKKKGIFNTNKTNSVRPAIIVTEGTEYKGYRISPMIRFKTSEREKALNNEFLESKLGDNYQIISDDINSIKSMYCKCPKELEGLVNEWIDGKFPTLEDLMEKNIPNNWFFKEYNTLYFPTSCRYYTVCTPNKLNRGGQFELVMRDEKSKMVAHTFLNSSFPYLWWRMFDGAINYPKDLLLKMPVIDRLNVEKFKTMADYTDGSKASELFKLVSINDRYISKLVERSILLSEYEHEYKVTKSNKGEQENIKFPIAVRDDINELAITSLIGANKDGFTYCELIKSIHSNNLNGTVESEVE